MKMQKFSIFIFIVGLMVALFSACQPDEYELGKVISKEELRYSIVQDTSDPNMIILKSETPGATPLWITPMGRSTRLQDTVRIPFAGEYNFIYGVESAGGFVQADTFKIVITTNNLNYVNDPLWTLLSGGVGNEKTWLLDLDANGVCKYFTGPLYFYGTEDSWETMALYKSGKTADEIKALLGITDTWNWEADWKGNSWIMPAGDYGTMTFSLKGNATVTVDHKMLGRVEQGTYFLDVTNKVLRLTDASPLHDQGRDGAVVDWGNLKLMSLTENTMQLAALRDKALSGEDPCLLVYNFISKDYADNWVPGEQPVPEPQLPDGWKDDVTKIVLKTITWKLSDQNPIDWCNLDGSRMNGWNTPSDYPAWLGTPDPSIYSGFSLTLNSDENTVEFVAPDGTKQNGTFTLDDKGIYTFSGISPNFSIISWATFHLSDNNQLRIMSIEKDGLGNVTGMWVGAKDPVKDEYMAYHLVPSVAGSSNDPVEAMKKAIVKALTGSGTRTFKPDLNWFVDWVSGSPNFTGGWTSSSTFGTDYTSNSWVWNATTAEIASSASLQFTLSGNQIQLTVKQKLYKEHQTTNESGESIWVTDQVIDNFTNSGSVTVNAEDQTLAISIPLIDYSGSPARWLSSTGNEGVWYLVPHGGSTYTNVETNGIWLGYTSKTDETTILHYVVAE